MINASIALVYDFNRLTQTPHSLMNKPALDRQVNNSHFSNVFQNHESSSKTYYFFTFLSNCTQTVNKDSFNIKLPEIVPLNVLPHNKQKLSDVTLIMHHYEQFLFTSCTKAGIDVRWFHIGGDQLTMVKK